MAIVDKAAIGALFEEKGPVGALHAAAQQVMDEIVRIAPSHTGYYDRSIRVGEPVKTVDGPMIPVESTDPFAHLVEFGSINNEPYAPMRRAARNLGLKIVETPRP